MTVVVQDGRGRLEMEDVRREMGEGVPVSECWTFNQGLQTAQD